MNQQPKIVLASQSPRRVELLRLLGLQFEVLPSDLDESTTLTDPSAVVLSLATMKANSVAQKVAAERPGEKVLVLGADTIVVLGDAILGKPVSRDDAHQMLSRMSGKPHKVFTGVAIVDTATGALEAGYDCSDVFFRSLDQREITSYVSTEEPMDKAGSYAVQGTASAFIERINGCYTNIIGLPTPLTVRLLRKFGVSVLGVAE